MKKVNVNTVNDTKVVSITELYQLVPDLRKFEGLQFKDFKSLLSQFIPALEETTAGWEFVQCIQGNPILFIIRKRMSHIMSMEEEKYPSEYQEIQMHKISQLTETPQLNENQSLESKYSESSELAASIKIPEIKIPEIKIPEVQKLFDKIEF
jgi:hypothetical protein